MVTVSQIKILPDDLPELATKARNEGFRFLDRLAQEFADGKNTFAKTGEALFEVRDEGRLVGVGGLNIDPYGGDCTAGRVRRLYVDPDHRGNGIGKILMGAIEDVARDSFSELRLLTDTTIGARFYDRLGYRSVSGHEHVSHIKIL